MLPQTYYQQHLVKGPGGIASSCGPWSNHFNWSQSITPSNISTNRYNQFQHWQHCGHGTASPSTSFASSDDTTHYYQLQEPHHCSNYAGDMDTAEVWRQTREHPTMFNKQQNPQVQSIHRCHSNFEPQSMSDLIIFKERQPRNPKPRARISIVRAADGTTRTIVKRKRKRTAFTTEQVEVLERYFSKKQYVHKDDRKLLVHQLQVNDKAVKVWFQNRRIKEKKIDASSESISDDEDIKLEYDLDYVEAQIKEKTDEFGYVTLDNRALEELAKAINEAVLGEILFYKTESNVADATDTETSATCEESSTDFSASVNIYEPISPVNLTDCERDDTVWSLLRPEETLQALLEQ